MAHTAYLLACAGMNFYAGYTPDITRRVFLHETGRGARYTRAHRPVRLVYTEESVSYTHLTLPTTERV